MWRMEQHVPRGGGNSLKPSHNQDFSLIEAFNNLAPWGEKKFVSELKRTYKFQRGGNNILDCHAIVSNYVKRHTEDNSPKYRMVGNDVGLKSSHFSLKSAAFTLAEVLVTLGIIGVVSAMTVPTLMQNYQRQSYVTQLHKVYNEMLQGFQQMMTDRNALNLKETGLLNTTEQATETFKNYFKVVQDCGNNFSPCFASEYRSTTGSSIKPAEANWWSSSFVLADGAAIGLHGLIDYSAGNVSYPYGYMYVDINGAKGPNIVGRDFFLFYYFNDGTLDDVVTPECKTAGICSSTLEVQRVNYSCVGQTWPAGCFGRILNDNWQMTY